MGIFCFNQTIDSNGVKKGAGRWLHGERGGKMKEWGRKGEMGGYRWMQREGVRELRERGRD